MSKYAPSLKNMYAYLVNNNGKGLFFWYKAYIFPQFFKADSNILDSDDAPKHGMYWLATSQHFIWIIFPH